jgi:hypothetical protein
VLAGRAVGFEYEVTACRFSYAPRSMRRLIRDPTTLDRQLLMVRRIVPGEGMLSRPVRLPWRQDFLPGLPSSRHTRVGGPLPAQPGAVELDRTKRGPRGANLRRLNDSTELSDAALAPHDEP